MYLEHFSLREAPFSITPDTAYFYPHDGMQAALNTLLIALRSGEGFLKIVGDVGCGKTVLCRQLLKVLQPECVTAYIPNPAMKMMDLLLALCRELGIEQPPDGAPFRILDSLQTRLLEHAAAGRRVVLCIDEAQAIPIGTLEGLRLLSNLETEKRKLLQIVLLGQPELDIKLARPEIRQLMQRITFSEYLGPMPFDRVPAYLAHRLATATRDDANHSAEFRGDATRALASFSRGVPRLLNVLANKCLMLAYGESAYQITARHARLAAADTNGLELQSPWWRYRIASSLRKNNFWPLAVPAPAHRGLQ